MEKWPRLLPAGDLGLLIEFGDRIDPDINLQVRKMAHALRKAAIEAISELVPAYRSILVLYDPCMVSFNSLKGEITKISENLEEIPLPRTGVHSARILTSLPCTMASRLKR